MKPVIFALAIAASSLTAASAQEAPHGPCQRSVSPMSFGGIDMDEMKCQLATAGEQISTMSLQSVAMSARLRMAQSDLQEAKAENQKLQAENEKLKAPAKIGDMSQVIKPGSLAPYTEITNEKLKSATPPEAKKP